MLRAISILLLLSLSHISSAARFEQAYYNFHQKNYDISLVQFKELSELGNKDAQYQVGVQYYKGWGVKKDLAKAYAWFKLSATKGHAEYQKSVAIVSKKINEEERQQANVEFENIGHKYSDEACSKRFVPKIGSFKDETYKRHENYKARLPRYPKLAGRGMIQGNALYQVIVGKDGRVKHPKVATYTNKIFKKPTEQALLKRIFLPAYLNGKPTETYGLRLAYIYKIEDATLQEKKIEKTLDELRDKAKDGSSIDRYAYAVHLRSLGPHISKSLREKYDSPNKWLLMSAVDGLTQAKVELAGNILYGEQCLSDLDKSYAWLKSAVADKDPHAKMLLGLELYSGERITRNVPRAFKLLDDAAKELISAKIEYARILATTDIEDAKDVKKAQNLLVSIKDKDTLDLISLYEARTIVAKVAGDNQTYVKYEKKLKKRAKKLDLPDDIIVANIDKIIRREPLQLLSEG